MGISSEKARNRKLVIEIFKGRCALNPVHAGNQVHEIIPRSIKKDWWEIGNQVLLCPECHDKIHRTGTKNYVDQLKQILWTKLSDSELLEQIIKMNAS